MNIELEWERKRNILKKQNIYIFLNQELECAKVIDKIMFSAKNAFFIHPLSKLNANNSPLTRPGQELSNSTTEANFSLQDFIIQDTCVHAQLVTNHNYSHFCLIYV